MKSIIIDERISRECKSALEKSGFHLLPLPACAGLPEAIRSHPDSVIFRHGKRLFTYASYAESGAWLFSDIREYHRDTMLSFVYEEPKGTYPEDARLNALVMGDRIFARRESLAEGIKEYANLSGLKVISTRQGYPACTTLAIDGCHAVTADKGLKRSLEAEGINVLLISEGGISLSPYEYGFIGGASFVYRDTVYFFGDIMTHGDGERISEFIKACGYNTVSLSDGGLVDLGGAVVLD